MVAATEGAIDQPTQPCVLHVVGHVSDSVIDLLGPGTESLLHGGMAQTVVLLDAEEYRHLVLRFADGVELIPVRTSRLTLTHWIEMRRQVRRVLDERAPLAVHFHGLLPWLFSAGLVSQDHVTVCLTPHGSRVLGRLRPLLTPMAALLRPMLGSFVKLGLVNNLVDFQYMKRVSSRPLLIEGVVDDAFFTAVREEAPRPLIVSGCDHHDREAVDLFCRLAVIFSERELDLAFAWYGPLTAASADQLAAAGIGRLDGLDSHAAIDKLSSAWVFIACGAEAGFPLSLAQAMAVGLACLVTDHPGHRTLIREGDTGLVYRSPEHVFQLLTQLLDDASLRQRLGRAAQREALQRFSQERFGHDLRALYHGRLAA